MVMAKRVPPPTAMAAEREAYKGTPPLTTRSTQNQETEGDGERVCGAELTQGGTCQRPKDTCHYHNKD